MEVVVKLRPTEKVLPMVAQLKTEFQNTNKMTTKKETPKNNLNATIGNTVLDDGLTYQQAKAEMRKGKWVRHRYFSDNEAMTDLRGKILFENDICVPYGQFELYRFTNSRNISAWVDGGWSVCEKPII